MPPNARAAWLPIPVAFTVALPAYVGLDIPIGSHILFLDRAAPLAAEVALGLWAARTPAARAAVCAAALFCLWAIFTPRGFFWPSYTWPSMALCAAVLWSMIQLVRVQLDLRVAIAGCFGATLWVMDSFIMTPWCGAAIGFEFTTASTACGQAVGDLRAMVPTLLLLAGWLIWLRRAGRS